MTRSTRPARAPSRNSWAILVLTASALALGACGRKGGLDLPPQASGQPPAAAAAADPDANSAAAKGASVFAPANPADEVQATRGRKRSFVLDPLLD